LFVTQRTVFQFVAVVNDASKCVETFSYFSYYWILFFC